MRNKSHVDLILSELDGIYEKSLATIAERDALRAENERLRAALAELKG